MIEQKPFSGWMAWEAVLTDKEIYMIGCGTDPWTTRPEFIVKPIESSEELEKPR